EPERAARVLASVEIDRPEPRGRLDLDQSRVAARSEAKTPHRPAGVEEPHRQTDVARRAPERRQTRRHGPGDRGRGTGNRSLSPGRRFCVVAIIPRVPTVLWHLVLTVPCPPSPVPQRQDACRAAGPPADVEDP